MIRQIIIQFIMNKNYHYQVNHSQKVLSKYYDDSEFYYEEIDENKFQKLNHRKKATTFGKASRQSSFLELSQNPTSPGQYEIDRYLKKPVMSLKGYSKRITDSQSNIPGVGTYQINQKLIPKHKIIFNKYKKKQIQSQENVGPGSYDSLNSSFQQGPQFPKSERRMFNSELINPGVGSYEIQLPQIDKAYTFKKNLQAEKTEKLQKYRESKMPSPFSYQVKQNNSSSPSCVWSKMGSKKLMKFQSETPGPGSYLKNEEDKKRKNQRNSSFLVALPESYRQLLYSDNETVLQNPNILSQIAKSPTYRSFSPKKKLKFKLMLKNIGYKTKKILRKKSYIPGPGEYNVQLEKNLKMGFAQSMRKYEFLTTGAEANPGPANYTDVIKETSSKGGQISRAKKPELFQIVEGPDPGQYEQPQSTFGAQKVKRRQKKHLSINLDELANIIMNFE